MGIMEFVTSFFVTTTISINEATMLFCFGLSWPVSIIKALRTKIVMGKSPFFMSLIAIGYMSGIVHKVLYSRDWVVMLYMFNLSMVLIDLYLYIWYSHLKQRAKTDLSPIKLVFQDKATHLL